MRCINPSEDGTQLCRVVPYCVTVCTPASLYFLYAVLLLALHMCVLSHVMHIHLTKTTPMRHKAYPLGLRVTT